MCRPTHVSRPIPSERKLSLGRHIRCGIIGIKSLLEILQNSEVLQFKDIHQDKPPMFSGVGNTKTLIFLRRTTWSNPHTAESGLRSLFAKILFLYNAIVTGPPGALLFDRDQRSH